MSGLVQTPPTLSETAPQEATSWKPKATQPKRHWDLAFFGIVGYLVIEYTRLPAMFPVLIPFQLGKVVIILSLLGMTVSASLPRRAGASPSQLNIAMGLFVFAVAVTCLLARNPTVALGEYISVVQWGLIYFLLSRIVNNAWRLRFFVTLFLVLNFKMAQFAVRMYQDLRSIGDSTEILSTRGVGAGSTGFFGNPGDFGVAMAVALPVGLALWIGEKRKWWRLGYLVASITFLAAIFLCGSRGALVAAAIVVLGAFAKNIRKILAGLVVLALFGIGFYLMPTANKDRLMSATNYQKDATAQIRLRLWRAGWKMFTDYPISGVGYANFRSQYASEYRAQADFAWAPHSIYIQSLSELGLIGTVPLVSIWLAYFASNWSSRKRLLKLGYGREAYEFRLSIALDLALLAYLVSGAFLTVLFYPHLYVLSGLTAGLYTHCRHLDPVLEEVGGPAPSLA